MKPYIPLFEKRDYEKERKDAKSKNVQKRKDLEDKINSAFSSAASSLKIEVDTLKGMVSTMMRTGHHPNKVAAGHVWGGKVDFTDVDFGDTEKYDKKDLTQYKRLASALGKLEGLKQKYKKLK